MSEKVHLGKIEQAGIILNMVAELAASVERLTVNLISEEQNSDRTAMLVAIKVLAQQIGWQSDLGAEKIGAGACFGDAEYWMLPPSYHDFEQDAQLTEREVSRG
jgi:hypothetical protein